MRFQKLGFTGACVGVGNYKNSMEKCGKNNTKSTEKCETKLVFIH